MVAPVSPMATNQPLTASARLLAVAANHTASRVGPNTVARGANAASTIKPNSNIPTAIYHDRRRGPTQRPRLLTITTENQRGRGGYRSGEYVIGSADKTREIAAGSQEVGVGLPKFDRPPPALRSGWPDPC